MTLVSFAFSRHDKEADRMDLIMNGDKTKYRSHRMHDSSPRSLLTTVDNFQVVESFSLVICLNSNNLLNWLAHK